MNKETVPLKYVKTFMRVAEAQGYDIESVAVAIGLEPELIHPKADQSQPVAAEIYTRIYTHVMDLLQDESFGLKLKHKVPTGSFKIMCRSLIHSVNLEEALLRAAEFHAFCQSLSGDIISLKSRLVRADESRVLYYFPDTSDFLIDDDIDPFYSLANCLSVWRRFCSWLIGRQLELIEVHIQLPAPEDQGYLKKLFRCPVKFNQASNAIIFDPQYLQAPLVHDENSLRDFLRSAPYQLLVTSELENDDGVLAQMRRIIGHGMSREFPSVIDMSSSLNISVRTLRRRLKNVGTTYQEFKDQTRYHAARQLLAKPELKINAIAALLGFDEPSAFHRSFKKWTKQTPGEYRQSLL